MYSVSGGSWAPSQNLVVICCKDLSSPYKNPDWERLIHVVKVLFASTITGVFKDPLVSTFTPCSSIEGTRLLVTMAS